MQTKALQFFILSLLLSLISHLAFAVDKHGKIGKRCDICYANGNKNKVITIGLRKNEPKEQAQPRLDEKFNNHNAAEHTCNVGGCTVQGNNEELRNHQAAAHQQPIIHEAQPQPHERCFVCANVYQYDTGLLSPQQLNQHYQTYSQDPNHNHQHPY